MFTTEGSRVEHPINKRCGVSTLTFKKPGELGYSTVPLALHRSMDDE